MSETIEMKEQHKIVITFDMEGGLSLGGFFHKIQEAIDSHPRVDEIYEINPNNIEITAFANKHTFVFTILPILPVTVLPA